jgi:hypothetical protein
MGFQLPDPPFVCIRECIGIGYRLNYGYKDISFVFVPSIANRLTRTHTYIYIGEFELRSWRGVLDTTLCDKFVSELRQVGGFPRVPRFPPPIKLTRAPH